MGVPTTANYCIMAATCAPILMDPSIGVTKMAAHFFVFYFGIVADSTPPVALAGLCRQRHRQGGPHEDRLQRHEAGHRGLYRALYLRHQPADCSSWMCPAPSRWCRSASPPCSAFFGVAAALNGYLYRPIPLVLRLAMAVGGLCMMIPGTVSDIIGFVLVLGILLYQRLSARRAAAA